MKICRLENILRIGTIVAGTTIAILGIQDKDFDSIAIGSGFAVTSALHLLFNKEENYELKNYDNKTYN